MLLDGVEKDGVYEVVVTSFNGGGFIRYRVGDFIRIVALTDPTRGVSTPEMVFHVRTNDRIDIATLVRPTELMIWRAVDISEISYIDWAARKEYNNDQAYLAIYIEPGTTAWILRNSTTAFGRRSGKWIRVRCRRIHPGNGFSACISIAARRLRALHRSPEEDGI